MTSQAINLPMKTERIFLQYSIKLKSTTHNGGKTMANREKGTADADKYSELIQVLVKPATKKELQTQATIEGKTLSCYLREVCEEEAKLTKSSYPDYKDK